MRGSPTVLIDGRDPFAVPGAGPSLSCRQYTPAEVPSGSAASSAGVGTPARRATRSARASRSAISGSSALSSSRT